jgi:hypothetical protein
MAAGENNTVVPVQLRWGATGTSALRGTEAGARVSTGSCTRKALTGELLWPPSPDWSLHYSIRPLHWWVGLDAYIGPLVVIHVTRNENHFWPVEKVNVKWTCMAFKCGTLLTVIRSLRWVCIVCPFHHICRSNRCTDWVEAYSISCGQGQAIQYIILFCMLWDCLSIDFEEYGNETKIEVASKGNFSAENAVQSRD